MMFVALLLSTAAVAAAAGADSAYCPVPQNVSSPVTTESGPSGNVGYATYFEGLGSPYGACGVPQSWLADDDGRPVPFVALNTEFTDDLTSPVTQDPVPSNVVGEFANGLNCGRWLQITLGNACLHGSNTDLEVCIVGGTHGIQNYRPDAISEAAPVLYGYVADQCSDENVWCRSDQYHLDISAAAIDKYISSWDNRLVTWSFLPGRPPGYRFKHALYFGWAEDATIPYYSALIIYNTYDGISRVSSMDTSDTFVPARPNNSLGNMWILPWSTKFGSSSKVVVEVFDASQRSYGTWAVQFPCEHRCSEPTKAIATRLYGEV